MYLLQVASIHVIQECWLHPGTSESLLVDRQRYKYTNTSAVCRLSHGEKHTRNFTRDADGTLSLTSHHTHTHRIKAFKFKSLPQGSG